MTTSPRLTLKVVSPASKPVSISPASKPAPVSPPAAPSVPTVPPASSRRRWLIAGTIILGVIAISQIPTTFEVGGQVTLEAKSGNRRTVSTPIAGVIESIDPQIQPGVRVKKGQVIAQLRSRELEREMEQVKQAIVEANQQREEQWRRQIRAEAELNSAIAAADALEQKSQLATQVSQGVVPSQIHEIKARIKKQQAALESADVELTRFTYLAQQGAVSRQEQDKRQRDRQQIAGELEILQQSLVATQQTLFQQTSSAEIEANRQNAIVVAQKQMTMAEQTAQASRDRLTTLQARLQELQQDQAQLVLRSPIEGVIISTGFDVKVGKELKSDQGLLDVVNLDDGLTGIVQIDEQDINYVQDGKSVRFRLLHDKLKNFDAKVERRILDVKTDQTGQKRTIPVLISVQNSDGQLQNGSSGYARIYSEQIPFYQRITREVLRLFSFERL